ncbi:MAG: PilZ domain-containing protein [Deltaproteobacteria bacterium]|nr:PilZ domain-containing protein [Deltaproteobacteria bacterium]
MQYLMLGHEKDQPAPATTGVTQVSHLSAVTQVSQLIPVTNLALLPVMGALDLTGKLPRNGHRKHKRARTDELLIRVRVGNGVVIAKVEDISVGGLFARTQNVIPVGAFVEIDLLRPGHEELSLTGVIVADTAQRAGLAVSFQNLDGRTNAELRRVVLDQQVKDANGDPDVDVQPTRRMLPPSDELTGRDRELDELRRRVGLLSAENERQRVEIEAAGEAQRLVGRLQMEIERLKARSTGTSAAVDADLLSNIRRDAETAWAAIARLSDNCDKIK